MRSRRADDRLTLLKTDLRAGHAGPSDRYALLKERACEYAFLIRTLAPECCPELSGDDAPGDESAAEFPDAAD